MMLLYIVVIVRLFMIGSFIEIKYKLYWFLMMYLLVFFMFDMIDRFIIFKNM